MIDGKVMQVLTDTKSAMTCVYCGVTPKDMNNLKTKDVNIDALKYGLSPLHAYIRFFECVLHIAYRIDIKLWRVTKENKEKLESKKAKIQNDFRKDLGLIIGVSSPGGSGTSNDGNSTRCFFEEYEISARITGVNVELIRRLGVILKTINCRFDIDASKFDAYCHETFKLYIKHYDWFKMPRTMHQILAHGSVIISNFTVPIGSLSEEAQESRNKDLKYTRTHHTRKANRKQNNADLIHSLLVSSDPYITSLRKQPSPHASTSLSKEMLNLLKPYTKL